MIQVTIGYVAGFIAAAIFVVRIWAPTVLTFILSSILRDTNTAATWTVAARAFERSQWPTLLRSDSVKNHGVRKDVILLTWFISLMGALIAIAGIVTPLGLYEAILASDAISASFEYIRDTSPFGDGTPDRSSLPFTRQCGFISSNGFFYTQNLSPCPFTDTISVLTTPSNASKAAKLEFPYGYNLTIPKTLSDIYSSGTTDNTTTSNYFDIQWRRYQSTSDDGHVLNNGSTYLVGAFRLMQSMVLDNSVQAVEGLVVDMVNGGIGLRNHTVPPGFEYGVSWEEDILFIEPETACADTNTTMDYSIAQSPNATTNIIDLVLTDRGGFVNIVGKLPTYDKTAPQTNADLAARAYKAAVVTNAYTMMYYNITNIANETLGTHAFSYINSRMNKTYQLAEYNQAIYYDSLGIDATFNLHLNLDGTITNKTSPADSGPPSNPFGINSTYFGEIGLSCRGTGGGDYVDIKSIVVNCGIMRGVPRRTDKDGTQFDSASRWSQPLYACATAVKAVVKTVSFTYNSTSSALSLSALNITSIKDKVYEKDADLPIWGVENVGERYTNADLSPIWGLISSSYAASPNVSSIRQPHLYLPGFVSSSSSLSSLSEENLPGSDFYPGVVGEVYQVGNPTAINNAWLDYTGEYNMAMWVRWQKLSSSAATAKLIPNLIWTDYAAAAIVGTKGVLGPGNKAVTTPATAPLVTPTVKRIRYHWPFAIPAFLVAACLVLMTLILLLTVILTRSGLEKMRDNLQRLSPGRIFAGFLYPEQGAMAIASKEWSQKMGKTTIDLSGEFPVGIRDMGFVLDDFALPEKRNGVKNGVYERAPSGSVEVLGGVEGTGQMRPGPAR